LAITYHAGRRIQGTSTDATAVSGGWKELARTTLGSAGDTIDVSSLADKRYYMILDSLISTGAINSLARFNNDSGSSYAWRESHNGTSDGAYGSRTEGELEHGSGNDSDWFSVQYVSNLAAKEKLVITHGIKQDATGAGNAPQRNETIYKWANTSNAIDQYTMTNGGAGSYDTGSECVVLGWDPDDTHTDNFWEELASVDLSGGVSDNLSSGTFTAKKYLWVQCFLQKDTNTIDTNITFNNDTGSNYARRKSSNGGSDATSINQNWFATGGDDANSFHNYFIINNASNEKLLTGVKVDASATGAGTAPERSEYVVKWANTSNQITEIDFDNAGAGNFGTKSLIKVWGSN
jgi:hypothetical protein